MNNNFGEIIPEDIIVHIVTLNTNIIGLFSMINKKLFAIMSTKIFKLKSIKLEKTIFNNKLVFTDENRTVNDFIKLMIKLGIWDFIESECESIICLRVPIIHKYYLLLETLDQLTITMVLGILGLCENICNDEALFEEYEIIEWLGEFKIMPIDKRIMSLFAIKHKLLRCEYNVPDNINTEFDSHKKQLIVFTESLIRSFLDK